MSQRTHFWLRIVGLTIILSLEFGPRIWAVEASPAPTRVAAAANAR